jgi:mRNA-degrading endonuclease RelE of RelBE toxin-antitoxin system
MRKKIAWTEQAKADLRAIEQTTTLHILHSVARYLATGEGDVKRLQDVEPPELRLRAGDYRVRFTIWELPSWS